MRNIQEIREAFEIANLQAQAHTYISVGKDVMIYPCGFAWVYLKVKKNDKLGKLLEAAGVMEWDNYPKHYYYWVGDYNQSALHKETHAEKLAELLSIEFEQTFKYGSKLD